jgi:hypothetical protein
VLTNAKSFDKILLADAPKKLLKERKQMVPGKQRTLITEQ